MFSLLRVLNLYKYGIQTFSRITQQQAKHPYFYSIIITIVTNLMTLAARIVDIVSFVVYLLFLHYCAYRTVNYVINIQ